MPSSLTHQIDPPLPDSLLHEARPHGTRALWSGPARTARRRPRRACTAWRPTPSAAGRSCRVSTRARRSSTTRIASCRQPSRRRRRPSGRKTGCRDNHHVVQDQVREIRQDLPRKYYLELPKLADGPLAGYPRVYAFARELIAHTAGRLDLQTLVDFATAYQRAAPLTIGEIWAIPIMLRLGAGRGAAPARRRCRGGAPQPRSRARLGRAAEHRRRRRPNGSSTRCCATRRKRADACRPPSSSSCCTGCAISPRRPRRRGTRCSARSKARATRPTRCCALEHQREAAGQLAIGEHHHDDAAAVVDRLAALLRARQPGRADAARRSRRRVRADGFSDPRPLPPLGRGAGACGAKRPSRTSRARAVDLGGGGATDGSRALDRAPSRRLLPDLARTLPARARRWATRRRCATASRASSTAIPVLGYLGTIAGADRARRGQLRRLRAPARRRHERALARRRSSSCCR